MFVYCMHAEDGKNDSWSRTCGLLKRGDKCMRQPIQKQPQTELTATRRPLNTGRQQQLMQKKRGGLSKCLIILVTSLVQILRDIRNVNRAQMHFMKGIEL